MKNNKSNDELHRLFAAHKSNIPDDGFSQRVMQTLPDRSRSSPLRYVAVVMCAVLFFAMLLVVDEGMIAGAIADLIVSVCMLKVPSFLSMATYAIFLTILGSVGFVAYKEC